MELDPTDVAILRALQADARRSFRDLAREIGVSTPTVSARVARLEQAGILRGYTARIDPAALGETSITMVIRAKPSAASDVAAAVAALPWVRRVAMARGGRILVDATVVDPAGVDALLDAVAKVPDVVDAEHYVTSRWLRDDSRAVLVDRMNATLVCFECKGPILGDPIRRRIDGRDHFFCCRSCESLYRKRYETVKAGAAKGTRLR